MCSGECWMCTYGDGLCLASSHDDYFAMTTPEKVKDRLDRNKYPRFRDDMIAWLEERGIQYDDNSAIESND